MVRNRNVRAPSSGTKTLHVADGRLRFDHLTFQANDDLELKLTICLPVRVVNDRRARQET